MKKFISLLILTITITSFKADNLVYVCGTSNIYHPNTSHNSFKNCTHSVKEMNETDAISAGKRHCKCKQ